VGAGSPKRLEIAYVAQKTTQKQRHRQSTIGYRLPILTATLAMVDLNLD